MDIDIPTILPTLSDKEQEGINNKRVLGTTDYQNPAARGDFETRAKSYFDERNVVPMLNALLMELFLHQPDDPIDHMLKFLLRHNTLQELSEEHASSAAKVQEYAEEAVQYANRFKLPQLFDELLAKLLEQMPEDVLRFAVSYLRWHKNDFIVRQQPTGYRAYQAGKDQQSRAKSVDAASSSSNALVEDSPAE
eukprot:GILI01010845.1.p1 GENE.GILI01010845.1~~GILI01010845.1.p1  ORF type:complete len:193 (-),score=50.50 GILI01010845.1:259-837(-)